MIAFIFPGQGSQVVGMGRDLFDNFAAARAVFEEADDALDLKLSQLCFEGDADKLQLTENTQPALLSVSIAALRAAQSEGLPVANIVAGHSLGEYSALVAAGSLEFAAAVKLVRKRGHYMQEAVPAGVGAMSAIIGATLEMVEAACRAAAEATGEVCSPANINSAAQIVIAGHANAVEHASQILRDQAAEKSLRVRAIKLPVSAPFHCALMMNAQERLQEDLFATKFDDLQTPLVNNVDAKIVRRGDAAREGLVRQVSAPVRWLESVRVLNEQGATRFVEIGAGKVLSGLVKQTISDAQCFQIEDAASLKATLANIGDAGKS